MSRRSILLALLTALALIGLLCLVVGLAAWLPLTFGDATGQGSTRASLVALIFGAALALALVTVLVALGYERGRSRLPLSPLYFPVLSTSTALAVLMLVVGAQSLDFLRHGLRPTFTPLYEPETRLFLALMYVALTGSIAWKAWAFLRSGGVGRRDAALVLGAVVGLALLVTLLAVP